MRRSAISLLVGAMLVLAGTVSAQFRRGHVQAHMAGPDSYDARFHYCRAAYRINPFGDGGGWLTDYPLADIDLSIRLAELTKTPVSIDPSGAPRHLIVRLTDDELYQCPIIVMQEVGRLFFSAQDAERLRDYLLKGGFLWVDDFWGNYAWRSWVAQIRKALPPGEFPIVDLPITHPMFQTQFEIKRVAQIPGLGFWRWSGGGTSELGADSAEVHSRGIFDSKGRLIVFMTHNTDISDSWEREGDDARYFYQFSLDGYALAINVMLYAMSH